MIGVFDSGFGGLTILRELVKVLPDLDFLYLGDNARAPYGSRSFETIHQYTLQAVRHLFESGCPLVILACNTASARALRTIQHRELLEMDASRRVLGVIRPVTECVGAHTQTGHVGVLGTLGTVRSQSYLLEISRFHPRVVLTQEACPLWVPLVESGELSGAGAQFFVNRHVQNLLKADNQIDLVVLACTHYPLLYPLIRSALPSSVKILSQGEVVAQSLSQYLQRHPQMLGRISQGGIVRFETTDTEEFFREGMRRFYPSAFGQGRDLSVRRVTL